LGIVPGLEFGVRGGGGVSATGSLFALLQPVKARGTSKAVAQYSKPPSVLMRRGKPVGEATE
jgi:hypothetical protein